MIADYQTDRVYFSSLALDDFKREMGEITSILEKYGIGVGYIKGTRDYFCRDYMPVQVGEGELVQFTFRPAYLMTQERQKFLTDTDIVHRDNEFLKSFNVRFSKIILDGGNVIKWTDKVIITDRVHSDNGDLKKSEILNSLEEIFDARVIIVPAYPGEETGHADGLVRFINSDTVLTYNLDTETTAEGIVWREAFLNSLRNNGLNVEMLPTTAMGKDNWAYLNFLQVRGLIILPTFGVDGEETLAQFFEDTFRTNIECARSERILREGGVLNCLSWNVKV